MFDECLTADPVPWTRPVVTSRDYNLVAGVNHIPLGGRILERSGDQAALDLIGELLSRYLNGDISQVTAVGDFIEQPDGSRPTWLNQAVRKLVLQLPFASPTGRISPLKSITIGNLALAFQNPAQSYAPLASSQAVSAGYGLPFGISLNISSASVNMGLVVNQTFVANLTSGMGDANTFILTQNAGFGTGTLNLNIPPSPLIVPDTYDSHLAFQQLTDDLVATDGSHIGLIGTTTAIVASGIGQITLSDIGFTLPAGLVGLSLLQAAPTDILAVDVIGGTPDAVILGLDVGLTNPSNLILDVGDVTLQIYEFYDNSFMGRAVLPSLHLDVGRQVVKATAYFYAKENPTALSTLNKVISFLQPPYSLADAFRGPVCWWDRFPDCDGRFQRLDPVRVSDPGVHELATQLDYQGPQRQTRRSRSPHNPPNNRRARQHRRHNYWSQ